jgi:hypothetical protein
MLSKHERMELKDERSIKQESVRLVKAEKLADAESERRLSEAYNIKKRGFEEPRGKTWNCASCGYRDNNETRWICDGCGAMASFAHSTSSVAPAAVAAAKKNDIKKVPQQHEASRWNAGEDEAESLVVLGGARHYRVYNSVVLKERATRSNRRHKKSATEADHVVSTAPYDAYSGDALPPTSTTDAAALPPLPGVIHNVIQGVLDDDDDGDDEPRCGPGAAHRRQPHLPLDSADLEGSDDEELEGTLQISYNTTTHEHYTLLPVPAFISEAADVRKQLVAALRIIRQAASASVVEIKRDASAGGRDVVSIRASEKTAVLTAAQACSDTIKSFLCDAAANEGESRLKCTPPACATAAATATKHVDATRATSSGKSSEPKENVGYTHFVSLPLGTIPTLAPYLDSLFQEIRQIAGLPIVPPATPLPDVVGRAGSAATSSSSNNPSTLPDDHYGLDETVLQRTAKVHLTILMLSLPTTALVDAAKGLMPQVKAAMDLYFKSSHHTLLHLQSLKPMTPNIEQCNVLYLDVASDDEGGLAALQGLIRSVHKIFLDAKLTTPREVEQGSKIHATLINTKWRKVADRKAGGGGGRWQRQVPFNAKKILDVLGEVSLGRHRPVTIELSKLAGLQQASGYYGSEAVELFCA